MTVRCQLLVLLFLVSSVLSGPTRSAAESPDGSSSAPTPAPESPSEAMTSEQPETPALVQEPPVTPTQATVAPAPPETTTQAGPEVAAKISLTEPSGGDTTAPLKESSLAPETSPVLEKASSAPLATRAKQTSSEDPGTTEQERCAESPAAGDAEGSPTDTCGPPGSEDSEGGSDNGCIVDDHEYPNGARVPGPQDPCRPCFCHRKRVTCVELRCYTRRGCKPLFKAGVCCPTYDHCPPVALVNASSELERTDGNPEDPDDTTELNSFTADQLTDETEAEPVAHLVDSSAHNDDDDDDDSDDESKSDHDQDDDDGDDHDHSHHHHRQHHMLDQGTPLTSSATTLRPGTSFPFLVRGRAGIEVR